jgi:hypothetical protein
MAIGSAPRLRRLWNGSMVSAPGSSITPSQITIIPARGALSEQRSAVKTV